MLGREQRLQPLRDLRLIVEGHVDGGFPDILALVDLGGGDGEILFAEHLRHQVEDRPGPRFRRRHIQANIHGNLLSCEKGGRCSRPKPCFPRLS